MNKIWGFITKYKKTSIAVVIVLILGGWYYYSKASSATVTTYTVRPVALGTIRTTVSGTGQVSSSQQITINPKVSAAVTSINVKNGDEVTAGQVIATLDSTTAGFSLQNARISLAKLQSSNPLSVTSNQNSADSAKTSLDQSYISAFNTLTNSYNDMSPVINGLNSIFYNPSTSPYFNDSSLVNQSYGTIAEQYKQSAGVLLDQVKNDYADFRNIYSTASIQSTSTIKSTLVQENTVVQKLLTSLKNASIAINFIINSTPKQNQTSAMTTDQNNLTTWINTVSQDNTSISSAISSIDSNTRSYNQAVATLNEAQTSSDPLDLESAQLSLAQAQYTYDEYTIRAPISGVIGNVTLRVGDQASASSIIGTVVTKDFISHISLNEVDAAKVSVGQPVSVTFNAISGVTATGTVSNVDTIGAVSQGVVSYDIVISFHTDDPRIKAGMSVNAEIVTTEKDNVIIVPNSALKTAGNVQYVQIPAAGQTGSFVMQVVRKTVTVGLTDTTNTEITSGLNVGDKVVTKTVIGTATSATQGNIFSSLTGRSTTGAGATGRSSGSFGGGTTGGTGTRTTTGTAAASAATGK